MGITTDKKTQKCDSTLLKVGERLSETQYYIIKEVSPSSIGVENERGFSFTVSKNIVSEGMYSAKQYTTEVKVTITEMIDIFSQCWNAVFTVNFYKKPDAEAVRKSIKSISFEFFSDTKAMQRLAEEIVLGEERTLTGYMVKTENGFGRSLVIDLDKVNTSKSDYDNRTRQVDHRTINWLIFKGVKYIIKK